MEEKDIKGKNIKTMIAAVLVLIGFLTFNLVENIIKARKEQEASKQITLVTDNSRYFTALNCVKQFLSYVQNGTNSDILLLLNEEYKTSNRILESNVKGFVPSLNKDTMYEYVGEEMYTKRISKNITEYYIKGKIKSYIMDEPAKYFDYDVTIILYENQLIFSVKPGIGDLNI